MSKELQNRLKYELSQTEIAREKKKIISQLLELEKQEQEQNRQAVEKLEQERRKAKLKLAKKQKYQKRLDNYKKTESFVSGKITWKIKQQSFNPVWEGYVDGKHLFNIIRNLSNYELKLVPKGSIGPDLQSLSKKAELIMENFTVKNVKS